MSVFAEFLAPVTAHPLSKVLSKHTDASIEVDAIVPAGGSSHYVWVNDEEYGALVKDLESTPDVDDVTVLDELPGRALVRFEWSTSDAPVFDLVESVGGRIAGAKGTADGWSLRIRFPSQAALRSFSEQAQERGLDVEMRQLFDPEAPSIDDGYDVSPKQRETLEMAYEMGYFDVPRRVTLQDLAEELDISEQGVSERLRRGLATFLAATLQGTAGADTDERSEGATDG